MTMTTISLKIKLFAQRAVHKLALAIVRGSTATMAWSMNLSTTPSTSCPEKNIEPVESATEPESSDGARNAAGNGEAKLSPVSNPMIMVERRTRVAILSKGSNIIAAIGLDTHCPATDGSVIHAVGSIDPRCNPARHLQSFETAEIAKSEFHEALAKSRDRGWTVAHIGERNYG